MACSSSNRTSARALHKFRLPDTGRAQEEERTQGAIRVLQSAATAANGVGDGGDGFVLSDHAQVDTFLHDQQLRFFRFDHPRHRDAGPGTDHFGNLVFGHFRSQQSPLDLVSAWLLVVLFLTFNCFGELTSLVSSSNSC